MRKSAMSFSKKVVFHTRRLTKGVLVLSFTARIR